MQTAIRQTLILWVSLLLLGGLAFFVLQVPTIRHGMWSMTGEEALLSQIKGLSDLGAGLVRPQLELKSDTPMMHVDLSPFGVNVFLEQEAEPAKRELAVQMAADAGFKWLRQEFVWEDIEIHGKGDFEDRRHEPYHSAWDKYDHIVALADQYDLDLIVRLSNPPDWTRTMTSTIGSYAPPDDFQDYADFVFAVADRYQDQLRYYQIWNEPNLWREWRNNEPVSPEGYVELLKVGAEAAREADPDAVIIAGALSATIDLDGTTIAGRSFNDALYLQRMYDAGAAPYFDIMAVQGYGLWSGPTDRRMQPRVMNISRHGFIRDLMVVNGDSAKPIWISEMNWNAAPLGVPPDYGQVTEGQQARYLPLAYERLRQEWPWIGVANVWYLKRATDDWEVQRRPEAYFRLLLPDFTPLPVYMTMQAYTQELQLSE